MSHTKEPWEWLEHKFNSPPFEGTLDHECGIYPPDGEIGPVAIASGKADARRIVACVNACAGVTTEELEQGGFVAGLVEQRDELAKLSTWQPIATAPKGGTPILLCSKKGRVADGCWMAANSSCGAWVWAYVNVEPAYWMPLKTPYHKGGGS